MSIARGVADGKGGSTPALVYLSGPRRGKTVALPRDGAGLGRDPATPFPLHREESAGEVAREGGRPPVTFHPRGGTFEMRRAEATTVWVNGEAVTSLVLASGDVLELGPGGPLVRFRIYPAGLAGHKTVPEVFADCRDCARYGARTPLRKAAIFAGTVPRELLTQTSSLFRAGVLLPLVLFALSGITLERRSHRLEERFQAEVTRVTGLGSLMARGTPGEWSGPGLDSLRAGMGREMAGARERLDRLESLPGAARRVIEAAAPSTIFLQGAYGFTDPATGRPLRLVLGPDGQPARSPAGEPSLTPEGHGPEVEIFFTGTAFVATDDGLLLSNRHVALPWEYDDAAQALMARGFEPKMRRFRGFLPGAREAFDVAVARTGQGVDLALLRCTGVAGRVRAIPLRADPPGLGEEVVVLGYPLGIQAILARASEPLRQALLADPRLDFWGVAERLAQAGEVSPLATRGMVGQHSSGFLVYDAETTSGGSGTPVLDLEGRVVAVNTAILRGFGGSNMGVPARDAQALLEAATAARDR